MAKEAKAVININTCSNLTQPGETYYLTADIMNSATTCMNITANDIVLDCQGHTIDGLRTDGTVGIQVYRTLSQNTNVTIKNCIVTEWSTGIYFYNASSNQIINTISNNSLKYGILLYTKYSMTDIKIINVTTNSNDRVGIYFRGPTSDNQVINVTTNSNNKYGGFILYLFHDSTINNSKIQNNSISGLYIQNSGSPPNRIYNNFFNNTNNTYFCRTIYTNYWNTTKQIGERVYSPGKYIGGNYWTNSTGNDYSDTCVDNDRNGFCDYNYTLDPDQTGNNTDYLPLSNQADVESPKWSNNSTNNTIAGKPTLFSLRWTDNFQLSSYIFSLDNCTGTFQDITRSFAGTGNWSNETFVISSTAFCTVKWRVNATDTNDNWNASDVFSFTTLPSYCDLAIPTDDATFTINQNNKYYCLSGNKQVSGKNAINFSSGVQNSTLDCLGYNLDGNDASGTTGVYLFQSQTNNTIKNCNITDFAGGIYLINYPSNNTLVNNVLTSNTRGIHLWLSSNNTLRDNIANSNSIGICLSNWANYNTLINNTARFNTISGGIKIDGSNNNTLINNTLHENSENVWIVSSQNNTIEGGSIAFATTRDYYLQSADSTNLFQATNFTASRRIYFDDATSWFNYRNDTLSSIWLKTNLSSAATITRKLINWNQSLMRWNDSSSVAVTARYNLTGLTPNKYYFVYNDSSPVQALKTDSNGELPSFTIYLSSEHEIKVEEAKLVVNLSTPSPITCTEANPCEWGNQVYWINASVECRNTNCGNVNGTVRYNDSTTTMKAINTTPDKPFYVVGEGQAENPISCGILTQGQTCYLNWTVNATGDPGSAWRIDVNFSSDLNFWNDTQDAIIKMNVPPRIWNLVVRDIYGNPITSTGTGVAVNITVNVSDSNLNYVEGNFTWPNGTKVYKNLTYYPTNNYTHNWTYAIHISMPPGTAYIKVTAYDDFGSSNSTNTTLIIDETYTLDLDNTPINFSTVNPGQVVNAITGKGWPLLAIVSGNVPINLSQRGEDFLTGLIDPNERIDIRNMTWNTSESGYFSALTNTYTLVNKSLQPGYDQPIYYKLNTPPVRPQSYGGLVYVCGLKSGVCSD
ncbi:MAG: NosD domain-containing protein [Candidatus Aenigmarchaeota archaeon]|nr:NosD domain-containing protein [Candidatus Aenigmarchaeota archaeon]